MRGPVPVVESLPKRIRRAAEAWLVFAVVLTIRCYQAMVRPFLLGSCKFCPSCSEYGIEALQTHGLWRGLGLTLRRVVRCHPFGRGGIDPVPAPQKAKDRPKPE